MGDGRVLALKDAASCRWDLVSLGEVMLRLDPGEERVPTARTFRAWEGGGEYNVARNLAHCFGLRTTIVTALADNAIGRLVENLIAQGGVDRSHVRWVEYDGVGRAARNGLNFTERGFGLRAPVGCVDRGHTAVAQLQPGAIDWERLFGAEGARWFHTGGVFCGLSETTPQVAREAMQAARRHGAIVSYDQNYRESLWQARGGRAAADAVNRAMLPLVDVVFGAGPDPAALAREFPNLRVVAASRRVERGGACEWRGSCWTDGRLLESAPRDVAVLDRVGAGDAFAAGVVFGFLAGRDPQYALECGAALGAHTMTTPGDTAMATRAEIEALMHGAPQGMRR